MRRFVLVVCLLAGCFSKPGFTGTDGGIDGGGDDGGGNIEANVIFVTSESRMLSQLSTIAQADAWCEQLADDARLPANRYVAWLSTNGNDVIDRLTPLAPRGWIRPDGKPVARSLQALADGEHLYPPRVTELGSDLSDTSPSVLTATAKGGRASTDTCNNLTNPVALGQYGAPDAAAHGWTEIHSAGCDLSVRIYCLGVEKSSTVTVARPAIARTAFVSQQTVTPQMGRSAYDGACASEASSKQLSGTFLAAVALSTSSIAIRFPDGAPWVRQDGVVVLEGNLSKMHAPINLDLDGSRRDDNTLSGAQTFAQQGSVSTTCNNWGAATGTFRAGWTMRSSPGGALSDEQPSCNADPYRVICLEY